jgi:hypothetical protein
MPTCEEIWQKANARYSWEHDPWIVNEIGGLYRRSSWPHCQQQKGIWAAPIVLRTIGTLISKDRADTLHQCIIEYIQVNLQSLMQPASYQLHVRINGFFLVLKELLGISIQLHVQPFLFSKQLPFWWRFEDLPSRINKWKESTEHRVNNHIKYRKPSILSTHLWMFVWVLDTATLLLWFAKVLIHTLMIVL